MTAKRSLGLETLRFLRPTFCGLTVLAIAVLTCELLSNYRGDFKPTPLESDLQSITQPSPELSPEDILAASDILRTYYTPEEFRELAGLFNFELSQSFPDEHPSSWLPVVKEAHRWPNDRSG